MPETGLSPGSDSRGLTASRFLMWLHTEISQDAGTTVPGAYFRDAEGVSSELMGNVISGLCDRGWAYIQGEVDGLPRAGLEEAGREEAARRLAHQSDLRARRTHAREGLLRWLASRPGRSGGSLAEFGDSRFVYFFGSVLAVDEVEDAADFLRDKQLVARAAVGSSLLALTGLGRDCEEGLEEEAIDEFLRRNATPPPTGSATFHIRGDHARVSSQGTGVSLGDYGTNNTGDHARSSIQVTQAISPVQFAALVRQVAGQLGLEESQVREVEDAGAELHRLTVDGDDGEGEGAATARERIRRVLTSPGERLGSQLMLTLFDNVLGAVPGIGS